ncbi:MAG: site-2 protease family protein, partial [Thermoanaerobaculia bacterium]|nr:site-2 protease family protein [Thermoanaerobaculia bacterium]
RPPDFSVAEASELLEGVFRRLEQLPCRSMPVHENGRLVGMLTMENVGEMLAIRSALRRA